MKFRTSSQLRRMFLDFFKEKDHMIEPGVPLIPINDPSLLWINSGVSALKKYFDGSTTLEKPRIANSQRSIRTNDIENVGLTARHHTMFEMLGNFSIGDYFKKEGIEYAWEFLTSEEWIGMDVDKLYATVYTDDDEAYDIWKNVIGLDDSRIFRLDGNFWEIGAGPCGPNSEIFYDRGLAYDPDNIGIDLLAKDMDNDRYIEIWNIVFSQFNAEEGVSRAEYKLLPQKNIDTGMGLERLASIVQEAETNFETDLFMPIIIEIESLAKFPYEGKYKRAYKVIADHIRAITFALADGGMFSNEGRGYVLKRLLRRASRFGLDLGIEEPFLYRIVHTVVDVMNDYYPFLSDKQELVAKIIKADEERFHKTLASGMKMFEDVKKTSIDKTITGEQAFRLYDTYGFPIEIVQELSEEAGYLVDMDGFDKLMKNQQEMARSSFKDTSNMKSQSADLLAFKNESTFVGYNLNETDAKVIGLFKAGEKVDTLEGEGEIAFDKTVFYAESGGQISDQGTIEIDGIELEVLNVRKAPNGQHLHLVDTFPIKKGNKAHLKINQTFRKLVSRNHSATHLLHQALKDVLGNHVNQAGSYVTDEYLRFDFNHFEKVAEEDLLEIERIVNDVIFEGLDLEISYMNIEEAKAKGAQALFSDKYDDFVRVIEIPGFSIELCGGTHVTKTNELGLFRIEKEESVGSGMRRIIAKTSKFAYKMLCAEEDKLKELTYKLGIKDTSKANKRLDNILDELATLKTDLNNIKEKLTMGVSTIIDDEYYDINGMKVYLLLLHNDDIKDMKSFVDNIKNEKDNAIAIVYTVENKKPYVVGVSKDLVARGVYANEIAKAINEAFTGKGGGKLDMAQGATTIDITREELCNILEQIK
ncbi:alanine--tRNA ligase [Erysipelotrichaceae bacterium OttesenSCG-928-M19]|nr:alanine--tRNA ligase [Erysipelotrichaceae bacterium OttesenSCG-928-M19]